MSGPYVIVRSGKAARKAAMRAAIAAGPIESGPIAQWWMTFGVTMSYKASRLPADQTSSHMRWTAVAAWSALAVAQTAGEAVIGAAGVAAMAAPGVACGIGSMPSWRQRPIWSNSVHDSTTLPHSKR